MICGIDEAGRGPVLGPLVVAGVMVENDEALKKLQVRDSKKLTPARREFLAKEIRKVAQIEIVSMPAEDIDELRKQFSLNVLEAKLFATLIERLHPNIAYLDAADASEDNFARMVRNELKFKLDIVSKHGGDDLFPVVSAASIIAKTTRDKTVKDMAMELGCEIGSGYPSDPKTVEFIKGYIREHKRFPPHIRRSWKTCQRLWAEVANSTLDSF